ncbi:MAG: helix-turn-helix domain-containing protein [Anaerolineales bacterium]|nr:helix-turn-helix domain-containing protein [Anaerolineales bacterium]
MQIKPIKTEKDYNAALKEVEALFGAAPGTPEGDRLEILSTLIESYEDAHYDIPAPDPIEAINYFMESRGLSRTDIEQYIGSRARVSEILNRKRPLTLLMIQRLHTELGIPADVLVKPYKIGSSRKAVHRSSVAA